MGAEALAEPEDHNDENKNQNYASNAQYLAERKNGDVDTYRTDSSGHVKNTLRPSKKGFDTLVARHK